MNSPVNSQFKKRYMLLMLAPFLALIALCKSSDNRSGLVGAGL